jgi:hypothetical protein
MRTNSTLRRAVLATLVLTASSLAGPAAPGAAAPSPSPSSSSSPVTAQLRDLAASVGDRWPARTGGEVRALSAGDRPDPTGDAQPPDARADLTGVSADYGSTSVDLRATVADDTDPLTWSDSTGLLWALDTTDDQEPDFVVVLVNAGAAVLDASLRYVCAARPATWERGLHQVFVDVSCFGQPAVLNVGAVMIFDADGAGPAVESIDAAPDEEMVGPLPMTPGAPMAQGYFVGGVKGAVANYGIANAGQGPLTLNKPIVGMAATRDGVSVWLVASDGGIFTIGPAGFHGSTGDIRLNQPIVGMAVTPSGQGYWLVASDGGIFAFGDAGFFGSTGDVRLNQPIVGMTSTPSGEGYWLVARDGGMFTFGDAEFFGSTGDIRLNQPIVGMAATNHGAGYWLVASDGGMFTFGDARFHGSAGDIRLNEPIVAMTPNRAGDGYVLVARDGGIFTFGGARFAGTAAGNPLAPAIGIVAA